ncbi:hypothetical protein D516_3964 [Rhodobacter sp. AKP1]|nr:hypothetical protein D516_3964 [Rhodobacter sp. AKP1]
MRWLTWTVGALAPTERFCAFLTFATLIMPVDRPPDGSLVLHQQLPRTDVADLLVTTVESISRISHRLQAEGLIEILDPSRFRIRDLGALLAAGATKDVFDAMS